MSDSVIKKKKVAILGTVPHKLKAPFEMEKKVEEREFEIWAIAHACLGEPLPRVDRIFEVHKWDEIIKWKSDIAWKLFPDVPVYLREPNNEVKNCRIFPFDELRKKYNIFDDRIESLFTNSISEMMALAAHEGFEEVHVYGVNMSHNTEYGTQKPSCEYYLGLLKGLGIKIYVPSESDLCKSFFVYGKQEEENTEIIKKIDDRLEWLNQMMVQAQNNAAHATNIFHQFIGRIENCKDLVNMFSQKKDIPGYQDIINEITALGSKLANEMIGKQNEMSAHHNGVQQLVGSIEDSKYWRMTLIH